MGKVVLYILFMIACLILYVVVKRKQYEHIENENARIEAEYDENFTPTEIVKKDDYDAKRYIEVDMKNKKWRINLGSIHEFNDLRDFELLEKSGGSYTKSHTSPSMLSVALDMGAYSAKNTQTTTHEFSQFVIRISFQNLSAQDEYLSFARSEKGSSEYNIAFEKMEKCMSLLRKIQAYNEENTIINEQTENNSSVADELTKLKSLLDTGVITQEEFDAQKQKLL